MKGKKLVNIILALTLCPIGMYIVSLMMPKRYTATMSILVTPMARANYVGRPDSEIEAMIQTTAARSIPTTLDMIYSTDVLLEAIKRTAEKYPGAFADESKAGSRYSSLVSKLRVDNNKESEVVSLRVTMDDPDIAAETANNIGYSINDLTRRRAKEVGNMVAQRIEEHITTTKNELEKVDGEIAKLVADSKIGDPDARIQMGDRSIEDLKLQIAQVTAQMNGAAGELASAQQTLATTPKYTRTSTTVARNPILDNLDAEISRAESDLAALRQKFTENHPMVQQLNQKVIDLKRSRASQSQEVTAQTSTNLNPNYTAAENAVAMSRAKYSSLSNSVVALNTSLAGLEANLARYPELRERLSKLNREKLAKENDFQFWTQKRQSLAVTDDTAREAPVQIISTAFAPNRPSFPNTGLFVLMGLAAGIVNSALIVMPKAPELLYAPLPGEAPVLEPGSGPESLPSATSERRAIEGTVA